MEYSVQDVFNRFGNVYLDKYNDNCFKMNVFNNIIGCRTKKMGVNVYKCKDCGKKYILINLVWIDIVQIV